MLLGWSLAAASILSAGTFPIGLYNATAPEDYPAIALAGFSLVDVRGAAPGKQRALAEAAATHGLDVMANPREFLSAPRSHLSIPVRAWHLFDEPEVNKDPPSTVSRVSTKVAAWDAQTPRLIVIGEGRFSGDYSAWADVIALDWYPVPHLPLESLTQQLDSATSGAGGKPIWAVLQAMDWRDYPQRNPNVPRIGRFPEQWEIRFMTMLALAQGVRGILFYTYTKPNKLTLKDFPDQWRALQEVATEVRRLKPFLDAGPGTALPGGPGRRVRRWRLGRRALTIATDVAEPRNPLVIETP